MWVVGQCRRMRRTSRRRWPRTSLLEGLAGTQQYRSRPRHRRVIDMDRQKIALVVMGIQERELLVTVDDINRGRRLGEMELDPANTIEVKAVRLRHLLLKHGKGVAVCGRMQCQNPSGRLVCP